MKSRSIKITNASQLPSRWFAAKRHALAVKYKVIAVVALILVATASMGAQRQEREATVAGRDVTIQVTVHPHNDRARAAAALFQGDDFTVREEKRVQRPTRPQVARDLSQREYRLRLPPH